MKIGFIGLGIMGRPMAKNLLNAGVELLVSDLNKEAVADVVAAGAKEATYAEIGEQCGRIIIMVPSGAISKSILFDEDGVASTIKEGTVVCDMSSVTPVESKECYEGLKDKGVGFVDAPVSGGEPGAVAGTLAIMAGGDQEDFDAMKEYFETRPVYLELKNKYFGREKFKEEHKKELSGYYRSERILKENLDANGKIPEGKWKREADCLSEEIAALRKEDKRIHAMLRKYEKVKNHVEVLMAEEGEGVSLPETNKREQSTETKEAVRTMKPKKKHHGMEL